MKSILIALSLILIPMNAWSSPQDDVKEISRISETADDESYDGNVTMDCPQEFDIISKTAEKIARDLVEVSDHVIRSEQKDIAQKFIDQGVPKEPLLKMYEYYNKNPQKIKNKNFMTLVDYSKNSKEKRLFVLDIKTGEVVSEFTSHANGELNRDGNFRADPDTDGMLDKCLHEDGSRKNMTRPGFMLVSEPYHSGSFSYGQTGPTALKLDGLEGRNDDVRARSVVLHQFRGTFDYPMKQGWSWGCPTVPIGHIQPLIPKLKGGSLLYIHAPQCE